MLVVDNNLNTDNSKITNLREVGRKYFRKQELDHSLGNNNKAKNKGNDVIQPCSAESLWMTLN